MRRLRLGLATGALLGAAALALVFLVTRPPPSLPLGAVPAKERAPEPSPEAQPTPPEPQRVETPKSLAVAPSARPTAPAASRADAELIALEERALRRVDVVALLEASGVDVRALRQRADADDVLRRLAADELLTQMFMRGLFALKVYPPDVPREAALREARARAEEIVAGLTSANRAEQLARELEQPPKPPPEPTYVPMR